MAKTLSRKLGLERSKTRDLVRAINLGPFMRNLPPPPEETHNSTAFRDWGMMLNNSLGDCVVAGAGHHIQSVTYWVAAVYALALKLLNGHLIRVVDREVTIRKLKAALGVITIPDSEIRKVYLQLSPRDSGLNIGEWLKWENKNGLKDSDGTAHPIWTYGAIDNKNQTLIKQAIANFGGLKVGIDLPNEWYQSGGRWDFVWKPTNTRIIGGHDILFADYDKTGVKVVTWGCEGTATWDAVEQMAEQGAENWCVLRPELWAAGKAPNGLNVVGIRDAYKDVTGKDPGPLPGPVDPPPVDPPVPPVDPPVPPVDPPVPPIPPCPPGTHWDETVQACVLDKPPVPPNPFPCPPEQFISILESLDIGLNHCHEAVRKALSGGRR